MRFQGEEYRGQHEALIPDDLWERANAAVRQTRPRAELRGEWTLGVYAIGTDNTWFTYEKSATITVPITA